MKLPYVSSRYGAPMGRRSDPSIETCLPRFVRLFRVDLDSGGYDNGGAYWGHGMPLWCALDYDGNQQFIRAASRARAALELGIGGFALKSANLANFQLYGDAILSGRAPMPEGMTREYVIQWMIESGAAMGQVTARVVSPNGRKSCRYPENMAAALVSERGAGWRIDA